MELTKKLSALCFQIGLTDFKYQSKLGRFINLESSSSRNRFFWFNLIQGSWIYSLLQVYYAWKAQPRSLFSCIFHSFHLITRLSVISLYVLLQLKSNELVFLLNFLAKGWKVFSLIATEKMLLAFVNMCPVFAILFYNCFLPLFTFVLPEVHGLRFNRLSLTLLDFTCMIPIGILGALMVTVCTVTVLTIAFYFGNLL